VNAVGTLTFEKSSRWVLQCDPHVAMRAKRIFGKLSSRAVGSLELTHSQETCRDLEWFMERYPLEMTPADRSVLTANARAHKDLIHRLESFLDPGYVPRTFTLALPPRSYQVREAEIYLEQGYLLNGDDVGLGKTAMAITSFTDPRTLPAIVVTLAHLPGQWEEQIHKFAPDLAVHVIKTGTVYPLPQGKGLFGGRGPDVVVINYHKLARWAQVLAAYGRSVVFDEIQELRRNGSRKYDAAWHLASSVPFRLGLSATPIYNYGGEVFNVLNLLAPGKLGTRDEFAFEWCGGRWLEGKCRLVDAKAFGAWAREQFLIVRHTREEVGRELPPVIKIPQVVDTDRRALDSIENTAAELARIILEQTPLARGAVFEASMELSALLRRATGVAKAPYVADFVRMLIESGERVVLAGWHRQVYDIWNAKLREFDPVLYTGTESPTQKRAAAQAFIAGQSPLLILSLRSGAGLDGLQEASSCLVFGELDWSPGVHEQVIGRLARDGQKKSVVAYFLHALEGADPAIVEVLGIKRHQVEGIRNPTQDFLEKLEVDGEHVKRLAARYLTQIGRSVPDQSLLEASA
jgi:hypothetical protein